jgi:hypothetical protein
LNKLAAAIVALLLTGNALVQRTLDMAAIEKQQQELTRQVMLTRHNFETILEGTYPLGAPFHAENTLRDREAAAEFQKILDNRGVVLDSLVGPLSHVGLARAYVLQGEVERARAAYQDFFALWRGADSDIPILEQAKAELARLL